MPPQSHRRVGGAEYKLTLSVPAGNVCGLFRAHCLNYFACFLPPNPQSTNVMSIKIKP